MQTKMLGDEGELICPVCGFNYLHQYRVEIFCRPQDAEKGHHVDVSRKKILIDDNLCDNPSKRRHGLKIYFRCEGCPAKSVMSILQHKGSTYVAFE